MCAFNRRSCECVLFPMSQIYTKTFYTNNNPITYFIESNLISCIIMIIIKGNTNNIVIIIHKVTIIDSADAKAYNNNI